MISRILILAHFPVAGVFDDVASPEDLAAILELEAWTDDRESAWIGRLARVPRDQWAVGTPGATLVMAAYCYPNPAGGRFTTSALGAWYAAFDVDTAIEETIHHNTRRLRDARLLEARIKLRELCADADSTFHDIRELAESAPTLYDLEDYGDSQRFGEHLRHCDSNGVVYTSVRRSDGACIAVFKPTLSANVREASSVEYTWQGSPRPEVRRWFDETLP